MVVHGEDSLNDETEDIDQEVKIKPKAEVDKVKAKHSMGSDDEEGGPEANELEDLEAESEEELSEDKLGKESKDLVVPDNKQLSIRKQIENRILEGATQDELVAEGFNKRSIQTIASETRKKIAQRKLPGRPISSQKKELQIFARGSPPEALIESVDVPDVANGQGFAFEQGIKFGQSQLVLAVRLMQELAAIGVTQTKPLIDMSKSMREGEALAAKNAAGEAAMEAAGMVQQALAPMIQNIQRGGGGGEGADPMKQMLTRTMEPIIQKMMGGVLGRLGQGAGGQGQNPQLTQGNQQPQTGNIEGWSRRSE